MHKAVIYGFSGTTLTDAEKSFFSQANPYGFILFARNCDTRDQIKSVVAQLHEITGRNTLPILIDQEGGRVARLKAPNWRSAPPAGMFAQLAQSNSEAARRAVYLNARLIARELYDLGITVNCAPMADIMTEGAHDIVGDRAFGTKPTQVTALAEEMARGLMDGGVLPVIKHIPGHGRATVDSHEHLPEVHESLEILRVTDFVPFKTLASLPMAMTAHIVYTAIDKTRVATTSPIVIDLIRSEIGFKGLLLSDDLSMKALTGTFAERTTQSIAAGCDIALHCNGKMEEMEQVASAAPDMSPEALIRSERALAQLHSPLEIDYAAAEIQIRQSLDA